MRNRLEKHIKEHNTFHGQALMEFALLLPILLVLILGAMDLGRVCYVKTILTNAAREGANTLSRYPSDKAAGYPKTLAAIVTEGNSSGVKISTSEVDWAGTNCCLVGRPVVITIEKTVNLFFDGFLDAMGIIDGPVTISSSVTMAVQP